MTRWRPTLAQAFGVALAGLAATLVGVLALVEDGSRRALLEASGQLLAETSRRVTEAIEAHLAEAEAVVAGLEAGLDGGVVDLDSPEAAGAALTAELLRRPGVSALSYTRAVSPGFLEADDGQGREAGEARLEADGRWQVSVARLPGGGLQRSVVRRAEGGEYQAVLTEDGASRVLPADDPTTHPTFTTPSRRDLFGRALWSDLALAQGEARRRVVTVQQALRLPGAVVGVLRVSLWSDRVDELARVALPARQGRAPRVFLADAHGHLVARTAAEDAVQELDGDEVRVVPAAPSPALAAALASPLLAEVAPGQAGHATLAVGADAYLLEVRALPAGRTQGWLVGTLAPEAYFLGPLQASTRQALAFSGALALLGLVGGGLLLRATGRDLSGLITETSRLRDFDFAPTAAPPPRLRDVGEAVDGLERAKTALRALAKYVPLDLVRHLYQTRAEPTLGGTVRDVSVLFTDIEGFTTVSEALPLEVLAPALGRYLEALTRGVQGSAGIIDKYTGDGVMALWNAPSACEAHPVKACQAVLACLEATEALFASPAWAGLPRLVTRFGLHRAEVSVGHFGSPERMAYTAMGDGVNLASRLEGLNKVYGTRVLVSEDVQREAAPHFAFRRLDRVAVKGKQRPVEVYELLGPAGQPRPAAVERYETALAHALAGRFAEALAVLDEGPKDRPGEVLAGRCRRFLAAPPPPGWDGVFAATEK